MSVDLVILSREGDALKLFLYWYPGDTMDRVAKLRIEMKEHGGIYEPTVGVGEWVLFSLVAPYRYSAFGNW